MIGPILAITLWLGAGVLLALGVHRFRKAFQEFDQPPAMHGPTRIVTLSSGRKCYVGRAGSQPWIQIPGFEATFTVREATEINAAFEEATLDAIAYDAAHKEK